MGIIQGLKKLINLKVHVVISNRKCNINEELKLNNLIHVQHVQKTYKNELKLWFSSSIRTKRGEIFTSVSE